MVVAVVIGGLGGFGCFSTARYDGAHLQRVASINARYEAERQREDARYASLVATLDTFRTYLIPVKLGPRPYAPPGQPEQIDEHVDIVAYRSQCLREICRPGYVDALIRTYVDADVVWGTPRQAASQDRELAKLIASLHNQEVLHYIDEQARAIEARRVQAHQRLESRRWEEIQASEQQRSSEIASGRAVHRARLKAAARASTATREGPISAQICVGAAADQLLSRAGECRAAWLPGRASSSPSSSRSAQPPVETRPAIHK